MYFATRVALIGLPLWGLYAATVRADELSPNDALARLTEGNARFVDGRMTFPNSDEQRREETLKAQHPFAVVLTCSDSRVPVEYVFDQGIGDVFTIRVAGNVSDTDEIGTIEYGVEHLEAPLLVVMGHSSCGAVTAVVKGTKLGGELPGLVDNIRPAVRAVRQRTPRPTGDALIAEAIKANVFQSMSDLFHNSEIVRERVQHDQLKVVGAIYDLSSGKVEWLGTHPEQKALLKPGKDESKPAAAATPVKPMSTSDEKPAANMREEKPGGAPKPKSSTGQGHGGTMNDDSSSEHGPFMSDPTAMDEHAQPANDEPKTAGGHAKSSDDKSKMEPAAEKHSKMDDDAKTGEMKKPAKSMEKHDGPAHDSNNKPAAAKKSTGADEDNNGPTAGEAFARLKDGNIRYSTGAPQHPHLNDARRNETSSGQKPFATVLCCSDSRVPPEIVFDQGIGDLFIVRVAGNVADGDEIGSAEYAVGHLNTPVLLVLGHRSCGAVTAVVKNATVHGSIPKLVDNIGPAVQQVKWTNGNLAGPDLIAAAIKSNVWRSVEDILRRSPEVRERVEAGKLLIVGGVYDLESGRVEWLGTHPEEKMIVGDEQNRSGEPKK